MRKTVGPQGRRGRCAGVLSVLVGPLTLLALLALWQFACSTGLVPSFMLPSPVRVVRALVGDWHLLAGHAATSRCAGVLSVLVAPLTLLALLALWQFACSTGLVPSFMLPSPVCVVQALVGDWHLLAGHAATSLAEAGLGLAAGVALGFAAALAMDRFDLLFRAFYPIVVLTQTIPTVAIAPLLVLWFGYGMLPKVVLIVVATFFPITVGMLEGLRSVDPDEIDLMRAMGATRVQILRHVKLPAAMPQFFSGLKISAAYAIVGAVIAEWLGGFSGLGVYMTRVRKAYSFDKMFAVIFLISALSLVLMWVVDAVRRIAMPWERRGDSTR